MADQIKEVADAIRLLESGIEKKVSAVQLSVVSETTKVSKVEAAASLARKVDRDELEGLLAAQRAEFETWRDE